MNNERYELRRMPLAHGVMGDVWQGRDLRRHCDVAVKFPRVPAGADHAEMARWFHHETRAMAAVRHPAVPAVFDSGTDDGRPFLVMRLVRGTSLSDLLAARGRFPGVDVADIGARACAALAAVHDAGLVHGDVEPANLMVEPDGTVLLVDFGLTAPVATLPQLPRHLRGRSAHSAPEVRRGEALSVSCDLYALGSTLRTLLLGEPGDHADSVEVPLSLAAVLDAMTAAEPSDRPATALEAQRRLSSWEPSAARVPTGGDVLSLTAG